MSGQVVSARVCVFFFFVVLLSHNCSVRFMPSFGYVLLLHYNWIPSRPRRTLQRQRPSDSCENSTPNENLRKYNRPSVSSEQ